MRVYNGDAAHGEYYSYQCDCGCYVRYKQRFCSYCGTELDWSKIYEMEKELDRRSQLTFSERVIKGWIDADLNVSDREV